MKNAKPLIMALILLAISVAGYLSLHLYVKNEEKKSENADILQAVTGSDSVVAKDETGDFDGVIPKDTVSFFTGEKVGDADDKTSTDKTSTAKSDTEKKGLFAKKKETTEKKDNNKTEKQEFNTSNLVQPGENEIPVFVIEASKITGFGFTNNKGEKMNFTKNGGVWTYDEDQSVALDQEAVESVAVLFSSLTTIDFIQNANANDFGFNKPSGNFYVKTVSDTYDITYGAQNKTTSEYYFDFDNDTSLIYYTNSSLMPLLDSVTMEALIDKN